MKMYRKICGLALAAACLFLWPGLSRAQNEVMGAVHFEAGTKAAKDSGVWVDGRYLGTLSQLHGYNKVTLIPGSHNILVRQAGYKDFTATLDVQPANTTKLKVVMEKDPTAVYASLTSQLKIEATPDNAGVFVDGAFAGKAHEFGGLGRAMILKPGPHEIKLVCPGYEDFDQMVDLAPNKKLKITATMQPGDSSLAASLHAQN
jgi:hypothetical protein